MLLPLELSFTFELSSESLNTLSRFHIGFYTQQKKHVCF